MKCKQCGNEFTPDHGNQRYCSLICWDEAETERKRLYSKKRTLNKLELSELKKCKYCGKNFKTSYKRQVFCSDECRMKKKKELLSQASKRHYQKKRKKVIEKFKIFKNLKKDMLVFAKTSFKGEWEKAYFSHIEDGMPYVFKGGRTSQTEKGTKKVVEVKINYE